MRKLCSLALVLFLAAFFCGCAENEYKVTEQKETQHESQPTDVKPGEMIVE